MTTRFLLVLFVSVISFQSLVFANDEKIFRADQTSASMLVKYAEKLMHDAPQKNKKEAEKKYVLVYDIYIKAHSYAVLNKVFFWFSIFFGIIVLLWPSLSIVFKSKLEQWRWLQSAIVQTTVTAIAALMFTFYSQYKDKQTYAETLMRYVIYSNEPVSQLAVKVSEELSKIDRGFSFNGILNLKTADKNIQTDQ
jgi:hypothetical protein